MLLDQFSRNIWRGTARAFAQDAQALDVARQAVAAGFLGELAPIEQVFLTLPFEHSESLDAQREAVRLCREIAAMAPPDWRPFMEGFLPYASSTTSSSRASVGFHIATPCSAGCRQPTKRHTCPEAARRSGRVSGLPAVSSLGGWSALLSTRARLTPPGTALNRREQDHSHRGLRQPAVWLAALLAIVALQPALAQEMAISEVAVDPPGRVARLSYVEGAVSFASADAGDWADAVLNRPLTSGDRLWLDQDARAELEVGSTTLHLDRETAFGLVKLDDAVLLASLTEGAASIRVRSLGDQEAIQIETPNATVRIREAGEYNLEVDTDSDRTIVRARSGEAEVMGGSASHLVRASQEGVFAGVDELRVQIGPIAPRTAFETWADDRARREDTSVSSPLRVQRGHRLRGPRRSRRLAVCVLVRPRMAAPLPRPRLGAVSIRPLGVDQSLGLDLDR